MNEQNKPKSHKFLTFIIVTVLLIGAIIGILYLVNSIRNPDNNDNTPFSRVATNNDIDIDLSEEFSLSINYKVTPKVDISSLQITFEFFDSNKQSVTTKIKTVGNVTKNLTTTVTVSLTEFSFVEIFKISTVNAKVTGGTVSYFA